LCFMIGASIIASWSVYVRTYSVYVRALMNSGNQRLALALTFQRAHRTQRN
jgi:hypothetical protein